MQVAYAVHTGSCTFLLDDQGVCVWVIPAHGVSARVAANAQRCIGAQYLASMDTRADGLLVSVPKLGAPMLFGLVNADGRISLVRTGRVVRFEDRRPRPPAATIVDSGSFPRGEARGRRESQVTPVTPVTQVTQVTPVRQAAPPSTKGGRAAWDDEVTRRDFEMTAACLPHRPKFDSMPTAVYARPRSSAAGPPRTLRRMSPR